MKMLYFYKVLSQITVEWLASFYLGLVFNTTALDPDL